MDFRATRDSETFKLAGRVHVLSAIDGSPLHGTIVSKNDRNVVVYDEKGDRHVRDFQSDRLWQCHCKGVAIAVANQG